MKVMGVERERISKGWTPMKKHQQRGHKWKHASPKNQEPKLHDSSIQNFKINPNQAKRVKDCSKRNRKKTGWCTDQRDESTSMCNYISRVSGLPSSIRLEYQHACFVDVNRWSQSQLCTSRMWQQVALLHHKASRSNWIPNFQWIGWTDPWILGLSPYPQFWTVHETSKPTFWLAKGNEGESPHRASWYDWYCMSLDCHVKTRLD